ncbi:MAG: hypothetical protein ACRDL5_11125 [Solirubrobacteraceae bacterium]
MSTLPISSLLPTGAATEPQSIRNGGAAAQNAYQEGLAFEDVLVNELAQQLTATVPGLDGTDDDGLGGTDSDGLGGTDDSGDSMLGGSAIGAYSSLLPQALSDGIMSGGGTGVAMQIAEAIDPALNNPTSASDSSGGVSA